MFQESGCFDLHAHSWYLIPQRTSNHIPVATLVAYVIGWNSLNLSLTVHQHSQYCIIYVVYMYYWLIAYIRDATFPLHLFLFWRMFRISVHPFLIIHRRCSLLGCYLHRHCQCDDTIGQCEDAIGQCEDTIGQCEDAISSYVFYSCSYIHSLNFFPEW